MGARLMSVVDLLGGTGMGPLWGMASSDLNATLLAWPPGHELVEDTNSELDVFLIVVEGRGVARVDEQEHALVAGSALLVEKGSSRTVRAGPDGIRYVSFIDAEGLCRSPRRPNGADREWIPLPSSATVGRR